MSYTERNLTKPIIGLANRTPLEVFDIMCDRIRSHLRSHLRSTESAERNLSEAQAQAQAALDNVMNSRFSNFDAGAVIHWAERGMYQVKP